MPWLGVLVAIVATAAATWLARGLARRFSIVAEPNPIVPQHREPVAYLGGVGLALGLLCALWATADLHLDAVTAGALGMLCLGLLDDLHPLQPLYKFLGQVLIAGIAVALGLGAELTGHLVVDAAIHCFLVVAWVNAVNMTDVCDGLVAGLAAIALLGLFALSGYSNSLALLTAAACLGLLVFNKPVATIYLGDAGSHLLGFVLAAVSIEAIARGNTWQADTAAVLCSGVFIFELIFLVLVRQARGLPWWRGSADHFSLRMQAGPFSLWQTILVAWAGGMLAAVAAMLLARLESAAALSLMGLLALTIAGVTLKLLGWTVDGPQGDPR